MAVAASRIVGVGTVSSGFDARAPEQRAAAGRRRRVKAGWAGEDNDNECALIVAGGG